MSTAIHPENILEQNYTVFGYDANGNDVSECIVLPVYDVHPENQTYPFNYSPEFMEEFTLLLRSVWLSGFVKNWHINLNQWIRSVNERC